MASRHGGRILADQLAVQGIKRVFSVPGESFLPVLDGILDAGIENIVCRHEGGASFMAEATGKLTGQPGIAFATRGPGATNAAAGVHVAKHDSTPMILCIGQVERSCRDREAFQEVNLPAMFAPLAKWSAEIDRADRIPEYMARAFSVARSGRPGPVVLSLPEDMLYEEVDVPDRPALAVPRQAVASSDIEATCTAISNSRKPLAIIGGSVWSEFAATALERISERFTLPVVASFRRQDFFDNRHPNYVGDLSAGMNPQLRQILNDSDLLLLLGSRLGDIATGGYRALDPVKMGKHLIQVHPDPSEFGRVWQTALAIAAPPEELLRGLDEAEPQNGPLRQQHLSRCQDAYQAWLQPADLPGKIRMADICRWLSDHLPPHAIVTNGAGNYAAFLHRHFQFRCFRTQLAPTSGTMGYGLPAAIAAKLNCRDRLVICMAGDGCFQMTMNEFVTACSNGLPVTAVVARNGMYGTIRMHQEKRYPGRESGTELGNPDFSAFALACGGYGETVTDMEAFPGAFGRAVDSGVPAIIDLVLDPEAIATDTTLSQIQRRSNP